jgi:hypothetical protein
VIDQFAEEYLLDDPRWTRAEYASQVAAVIDEVRLKYPVDDSAILLVAFTARGHTVSHPRGPVSLTSEITTGIAFVIFFAVYGLYRRWIRGGD